MRHETRNVPLPLPVAELGLNAHHNPPLELQHIVTHEVRLGGEQPVLLHGGGLLGVVLNKPHASGTGTHILLWLGFLPLGLCLLNLCSCCCHTHAPPAALCQLAASNCHRRAATRPRTRPGRPGDAVCELEVLCAGRSRAAGACLGQVRPQSLSRGRQCCAA